ncbi:hypothetical protein BYT27DRAFT_7208516 [Phlegmacium glaucopus]|nr:hypothetical protein BYT27DRAFT_7208516 [Phlegmacium glaucopus]
MSDCEKPTIIDKFQYLPVSQQRKTDNEEMAQLNYMTSRLRAALCKWAISAPPPEAVQWWWMGLQNKLDVAMGIIGYNAAYYNIFLDIPNFLRGLSQSIHSNGGPEFTLSKAMWQEIEHIPDPQDPTEVFEEYYNDWWNREDQWQSHPQVQVDGEKAFSWHIFKYGALRPNKHTSPGAGTAPLDTTARNTCKSAVDSQLDTLTLTDVKNLLYEAFDGCDMDTEEKPIAGPSRNSGPSTNGSFTPQSLSYNGYSDDSEYAPST